MLLSLSCYKLAYHYSSYTCWIAIISLLILTVTLLRSWRWDERLRWRFLLEACVASIDWLWGLVCSAAARWESRYCLLCKDNVPCNNVCIIKYWFSVFTFWSYVWQLDPRHTCDEHLILALKPGVTMCKKGGSRRCAQYSMEMDYVKLGRSKRTKVNLEYMEDRHQIRCLKCHKVGHNQKNMWRQHT
jgi:hypothetical protein